MSKDIGLRPLLPPSSHEQRERRENDTLSPSATTHENTMTTQSDDQRTLTSEGDFTFQHRPSFVEPKTRESGSRVPWLAMSSLFVALLCIMGCVLILKFSDGQPTDSWPTTGYPVQPSVMLSIGAALANTAVRFMFSDAVTITWWKGAQRGTTVGDLHRTWNYGTNLWSVFCAGRKFNLLALASLLVSVVAIDGPLLQKASRVATQTWKDTSMVQIGLSSNISLGSHPTGYLIGRGSSPGMISQEFLPVVQQYNARQAIAMNYTGCTESCTADIVGPGFDVNCTTTRKPLYISTGIGNTTDVLGFGFSFLGISDASTMSLNVTLRASDSPNMLTTHYCDLHLATVKYPVSLSNNTVSLLPAAAGLNETIKWEYLGLEAHGGYGTWPTVLGGIFLVADRKFRSSAEVSFVGTLDMFSEGSAAVEYLDPASGMNYTWLDPTTDFLSSVRELMFRNVVAIANNVSADSSSSSSSMMTQSVPASNTFQRTIYISSYNYLGYAVLVMMLAIVATSLALSGFWELGRAFTLDPFEVAKAFNSPFVADSTYVSTSDKAFKEISSRPVRYGVFVDSVSSSSRSFPADAIYDTEYKRAMAGEPSSPMYDPPAYGGSHLRSRIGMGTPSSHGGA